MTLSGADIKGALSGILAYLVVMFLVNLVLGFVAPGLLGGLTSTIVGAGSFLINYLVISLVLSGVAVLISFVLKKLFRL